MNQDDDSAFLNERRMFAVKQEKTRKDKKTCGQI